MELSDYKKQQKELEENFITSKKNLAIQYTRANNPHKIGDIVCNNDICIKVEKIIPYLDYDKPECIYKGSLLKKDLKPTKITKIDSIFQSRITRSINS